MILKHARDRILAPTRVLLMSEQARISDPPAGHFKVQPAPRIGEEAPRVVRVVARNAGDWCGHSGCGGG